MSKECLHLLLSAKIAIGALVVAAPSAAKAAVAPHEGVAAVSTYEILDSQPAPVAEFGERGDGQGTGQVNCA